MFLFRILLIITVIALLIPFISDGIDYTKEKYNKVKGTGKTVFKVIKYMDKSKSKEKD